MCSIVRFYLLFENRVTIIAKQLNTTYFWNICIECTVCLKILKGTETKNNLVINLAYGNDFNKCMIQFNLKYYQCNEIY